MNADIFFFITSIAVGFFVVCVAVVTVYVVRILIDIKKLSKTVSEEGGKIVSDVESLRQSVKAEGVKIRTLVDFFINLVRRKFTRRKK